MKVGVTPFFSRNRKKLLSNITTEDVIYPSKVKYSIEYSDLFMDVVNAVRESARRVEAQLPLFVYPVAAYEGPQASAGF